MVGKNAPVPLDHVRTNCETCGKEFEIFRYEISIARFCSRSCLGKWNILYNIKRQRPTSLEKEVKRMMESLDLEFEMEKRIKPFIVDFFVKPNFIIEADGNYWHRDEKKDKRRDIKLKSLGYRVLHLPEDLIKQDAQSCKDHILTFFLPKKKI
jgi:very-short-patch-repair endonuclease